MIDGAVTVRALEKVYPRGRVKAVDGVDLDVARGELFGLLGPNGAGKTTTVGICTTRVLPTGGSVVVEGIDVTVDPAAVRECIGVVTQYNTLDRACTVWENVYFHCRFFTMGRRAAKGRAEELLEQFRLTERAGSMPDELSGGMAQRLQVARAIAHRPRVLFLDEPTAGLDPQSRIALWDIVGGLRREGITVVLTTHYMEEAQRLCDRVAIIDRGRILVCDTPTALVRDLDEGRVVELSLDRLDGRLLDRLRRVDGVAAAESDGRGGVRIRTTGADGRVLAALVEVAHPCGVRDVSIGEPSLETVFIALTGRDLRE